MNFEEFARDSGKALTDATAPLRPPSITEISSRRRRSTLTVGAVGVAALLVGVVAMAGIINRGGTAAAPTTSFPTETTMGAVEASVTTVDLLDGSRLEVVGPPDLVLTGYLLFLDRPELGGYTNAYVSRTDDPAEAAAAESAELEADLRDGAQLWRGDREGQPLFMSVDLDGWVVFLHVGWDTPPDSADLLALADELRGEVTEHGVILPNHETTTFTTYLGSPGTENSIHLGIGECIQEFTPDSEIVEHPARGEVIWGDTYASWCDRANDLEVRIHGDANFVVHGVGGLMIHRTYPESQPTTTTTAPPSTTLAPTEPTTTLPPSSAAVTPIEPGPLDGRFGHSVVWTGSEMIVWGGHTESITEALSDGAAYDPGTDQWRMIAHPPLDGMTWHFATWSGSEMLVVGTAGAAAYEPTSDSWRLLPTPPIPIHRVAADISDLTEYAWSGEHIYVWNPISDELARLNPSASEWETMESPSLNVYPAKILAEDDRVLVFGTRWPSGIAEPSTYELFGSALTDAGWVELPAIDFVTDGYANVADPGTASFVGENVLVWGDPSPEPGNARLLQPDGTWSAAPPPPIDENILHPRPIGLDNGRVLALSEGGDAAIWNPIQNDWASVGSLPALGRVVQQIRGRPIRAPMPGGGTPPPP